MEGRSPDISIIQHLVREGEDNIMLKITTQQEIGTLRLILEGRLAGPWLNEVEQSWRIIKDSMTVRYVVDLTGVTYIEAQGTMLLNRMWQEGAEFIVSGCCNKPIVEHITGTHLRHAQSKERKRRI